MTFIIEKSGAIIQLSSKIPEELLQKNDLEVYHVHDEMICEYNRETKSWWPIPAVPTKIFLESLKNAN